MRKLLFSWGIVSFLAYALVEAAFSFWSWRNPEDRVFLYESAGKTIQFDPIRGYRLTETPSRWALKSYGVLEFSSVLRGNPSGFPDRDAFSRRKKKQLPRFAVFGDSFSSAQFLKTNWPDRIEDLLGKKVEFLNFSIDGGGIANWANVLKHFVAKNNYDVDYVLFAVLTGNMNRTFTVSDMRNQKHLMLGRIGSWKEEDIPKSLEEALPHMIRHNAFNVTPLEFNKALKGEWVPDVDPPFRLEIAHRARKKLLSFSSSKRMSSHSKTVEIDPEHWQDEDRLELLRQLALLIKQQGWTPLVFHLPLREELTKGSYEWGIGGSKKLAEYLSADFIDGSKAFERFTEEEIREHWLPFDGHWNQKGSDHFAQFVLNTLVEKKILPAPARSRQ